MKPNLIIIGAMKAGTTSLHNYLNGHPDVTMSEPKELNFFSNPKFWNRGPEWYFSHFEGNAAIRGETSTSYTIYPRQPEIASRMHALLPDVKLVYVLRDPIARFVSHYIHARGEGRERQTFNQIVETARRDQALPYVAQGKYYLQITQFLKFYELQQMFFLTTEELKHDRARTLERLAAFLGIENQFSDIEIEREHNRSDVGQLVRNRWVNLVYPQWMQTNSELPWPVKSPFFHLAKLGSGTLTKPSVTDEQHGILRDIFRDDITAFSDLTGITFPDWTTSHD